MATADEILAAEGAEADKTLVINNDLRTITIPPSVKNLGVESDDGVLWLHFRMPSMYGDIDLSTFKIRINYMNANGEGDVAIAKNVSVADGFITFSWKIERKAAAFKGYVNFVVCLKNMDMSGVITEEFNTTVAKLPVLKGLETTEQVVQQNPDVLEAILARLDSLETNGMLNSGTVVSENADFAEVGEWSDGNPNDENRIGYFVAVDTSEPGKTMIKATADSDVRGVTMEHPGFSANASSDKYDADGNLLKQYDYVCFAGFAPVIDNGLCTVNGKCMPADDGTAVPSPNNMGYQVIERIDDTHVLVLVEPQADMMVRIKEDMDEVPGLITEELERVKESGLFDGAPGADGKSAYQYAVEGGYTGAETEFAAKLAGTDNMEQISMLIDADLLPAVYDKSGAILTNETGNIVLRY